VTVARSLFVSSAIFAAALAIAYWSIAHEPAGTTLLAFMAAALLVTAGYMFFAERDADLYADRPDATPAEAVGEHVGTYVTHSAAPFWIGVAVSALVLGLVVSPAAAGLGIVALFLLGALLIVQSR
jgi:uncharacterized membrane protein YphA (DoxX/SURF4 family)